MLGQLRPCACLTAPERVEQLAVVVYGPAELTAGMLGQAEGQALLLLELRVEAGQPRAVRGGNERGMEKPVIFQHARHVSQANASSIRCTSSASSS